MAPFPAAFLKLEFRYNCSLFICHLFYFVSLWNEGVRANGKILIRFSVLLIFMLDLQIRLCLATRSKNSPRSLTRPLVVHGLCD